MSAGFAGQHVVGFEDLDIDVFLEVQSKRYSWIVYLIDYIVYGPHLWCKTIAPPNSGLVMLSLSDTPWPGTHTSSLDGNNCEPAQDSLVQACVSPKVHPNWKVGVKVSTASSPYLLVQCFLVCLLCPSSFGLCWSPWQVAVQEISRDVIFSEKKAPAEMPTHRTGVDNVKK